MDVEFFEIGYLYEHVRRGGIHLLIGIGPISLFFKEIKGDKSWSYYDKQNLLWSIGKYNKKSFNKLHKASKALILIYC